MRYQASRRCGNGIMVTGVVTIILGFVLLLLSQSKIIASFDLLPECSVLLLFIGAFIWLAGANLSGKQCVSDRYYLLRFKLSKPGQHRR